MALDSQTLPTTCATLIGLICNYRQERGAHEQMNGERFEKYLAVHNFHGLKDLISQNQALNEEIDKLLLQENEELAVTLERVERMVTQLLSQVHGFSGIARILHPNLELSKQALQILVLMVSQEVDALYELHGRIMVSRRGQPGPEIVTPAAPQYFREDVQTLCNLGFMSEGVGRTGEPAFILTRSGLAYANDLRAQKSRAQAEG